MIQANSPSRHSTFVCLAFVLTVAAARGTASDLLGSGMDGERWSYMLEVFSMLDR